MRCTYCFPPQVLVRTGNRSFCPLCERIYEDTGDGSLTSADSLARVKGIDFFPSRTKVRGDSLPFTINPAEDRFGDDAETYTA